MTRTEATELIDNYAEAMKLADQIEQLTDVAVHHVIEKQLGPEKEAAEEFLEAAIARERRLDNAWYFKTVA